VWKRLGAVAIAAACGLLAGVAVDRWAPPPSADVLKGTEDVFAQGLNWRELPPRGAPLRWTEPRAVLTFRDLPPGPASVELVIRSHAAPVTVAANGVRVTEVERGRRGGRYELGDIRAGSLEVLLETPGQRDASGRRLGTQLVRATLHHSPSRLPPASLLIPFALTGAAVVILGLTTGAGPPGSALAGSLLVVLLAAGLWPSGLIRSAYVAPLALELTGVAAVACGVACLARRRFANAGPWAFWALLAAGVVQGVAAVSPVMVTSDAAFHAHKLLDVSRGQLFPTSITPHAQPFQLPYGVSFYLLLTPLLWLGGEPVTLVRWGAALSGIAASAALFLLLCARAAPRLAGVAVIVLQLLPASFRYYSEATLSNVFGQSMTVLFFAWWAGGMPGGPVLGVILLAVGCLAHVSSLIVLTLLCVVLLLLGRREGLGRARPWAVAMGLALAALYYIQFFRLIVEQLPRLLEGAGEGGGRPSGLAHALGTQAYQLVTGWGLPAIALAWLGRPRSLSRGLDRDLVAYWTAGAVLLGLALVSPLEARYVYALTLPLAVAAAQGLLALWDAGGARRVAAAGLVLLQAGLAGHGIVDALFYRYRP
jgi:hypothetical protein